jgi:hypothetical protein
LDNEARSFKNEMLPEKADISLLKISICISVSAIGIQANLLVGLGGEGIQKGSLFESPGRQSYNWFFFLLRS